nr:MAG TPA: hypothetical protein [Bacteriophage sp.]
MSPGGGCSPGVYQTDIFYILVILESIIDQ